MQLQSLEDVFTHELQDLYDAETQLLQALPKMAQRRHPIRSCAARSNIT
jgi:ferritin-like metal-binding protein YciE